MSRYQPATPKPKLCTKCQHERSGWCKMHIDVTNGCFAPIAIAREQFCGGNDWEPRILQQIIDNAQITVKRRQDDYGSNVETIETDKATIHRDPWSKIEKKYD